MRLTLLHPDPSRGPGLVPTDVEAEPGLPLSALRPALARVSGYAGWASTGVRAAVGDALLDEHHVVGHPPLVDGCLLRTGRGSGTGTELAVRSDWHVAVVAGPDGGGLAAVPADGRLTVGPPGGPDAVPPFLAVADPGLARVEVRRRGDRVHVRVGVGRHRRRRRWRPHRPLRVGSTTLTLRGPVRDDVPETAPPGPGLASRPATWLAPLVGSVALAAALRQPVLLLVGLAVPLVALGAAGVARWRRRHRRPGDTAVQDLAALVAATARAVVAPVDPVTLDQPWDPGGSLAVVGPRSLALPVARAAALGALGSHLTAALAVRTRRPDDWSWCVWATAPDAALPLGPGDGLVVADDPPDPAALARWRSSAPATQRLLLLAESPAAVPAWCRARLEVGPRAVRLHRADGRVDDVPRQAVGARRALEQVRAAAAARARAADAGDGAAPPSRASLAALDGIPAPDGVAAAWEALRADLTVALGVGTGGRTVAVDLVADGPHALVAGTTGAGKSELLTALVLSLALTHPPDRLAILLVDFKGGTGLGPVAGLPHVLEHVTDLDAAHARRVLVSLRAELRRREAVLSAAGARDLRELDPAGATTPPRLLVVVDELRALTEDVPDASAALTRIAAQGRALGVHLVLATQRPAGAVGADLRANVGLRIALRVTDQADSTDVLDAPDASRLDPATPGRAWVRRGTQPLEAVQVARAVTAAATPVVRLAPAWSDAGAAPWSPVAPGPPVDDDAGADWVHAAVHAASGRPATTGCPWLPALPAVVRPGDVPDGPGLALAVADLPEEQRRGAVRWDPADGPLLVVGGPRSGRTTTLVTAALEALDRGWAVHTVGLPAASLDRLRAADRHGRLGSDLETDDARAVARLLELLAEAHRPHVLLVVDRLDLLLDSVGRLARGAGADRLTALWRSSTTSTALAAGAAAGPTALQHAGAFAHRLVLPLADATLDTVAGVPSGLAGRRTTPGRAVHLHATGAQVCQVVLPGPPGARVTAAGRDASVVLVRPLPERADLPAALDAGSSRLEVALGLGGDQAEVVRVDVRHGLLVAGPPGSGRSTALRVVARSLVRSGVRVLRLVDPAGPPVPALAGVQDVGPADLVQACGDPDGTVLLVDDLDDLHRDHPGLDDLLPPTLGVVAAVTSSAAAQAFRGTVARLVRRRRTLVLDVHDHASAELVGPRAAWSVDPSRRPAGRGVLLTGREAVVVQVYAGGS
ncbi:FtsK/SpoIIIE domain-containing protein [Cellulomonas xylanilytica]|uniref:FtsK domain-containing protein n=1 Tax=Cellulomonas xylanilytica TaxID=233583 RepID=A0A510V476_9CELL|nr:FtsK/SpoIIIE domain-containing protein [Cellulomonas xylanilytica]GEK21683.1 hypothetical protein CXY01_22030 [Cellulomonas xylanilytica]